MIKEKTVLFGLTGLLCLGICLAEEVEELEPLTVLARRIDSVKDDNASVVGIVTGEELARMQRHRLLESLELIPGTQVLSTAGLTGNTGTAIIRGLPSRYQQVLVDGVRVTDSTNSPGNFLANGQLGQMTRLEVLRGPQSVLYGSGAGGGVMGYETRVGEGDPVVRFFGEVGSFETYRASMSAEGRLEDFSYGLEIGHQFTANDTYGALPRHDYEQNYANLALRWMLRDDLSLKVSYRGSDNLLETRAITGFGEQNSEIQTETALFAVNLDYQVNPGWESRLTTGYYYENYRGDFDGFLFGTDHERWTFNWSHEIELGEPLTLVAGLESSVSDFANSSGRRADEVIHGAYANFYYRPVESWLIEAGARYDEHNVFGGDAATNLGVVYTLEESGTRFHARASQAYRNPSRLDAEFFPSFFSTQIANPDLESEEIVGWEVGATQRLGQHEVGLTYFEQRLENAIVAEARPSVGGAARNIRVNSPGESAVSGLEFSAAGGFLTEHLKYRLAFTAQFDEEVIDLPDQLASFDVHYNSGDWLIGAGVSHVGKASYLAPGNPQTDRRTTTRLYGQYEISEALTIHARIENLFDEGFELFPDTFGPGTEVEGPGRAFFVGATLTW